MKSFYCFFGDNVRSPISCFR
uniref:Uncharacterized protein n=1 Tax=Arundo donax TaxID=35708 RepID=A0A0A8ZYF1_ARUDO